MRFRYFLRGLGVGIVFSAIIFVIAYQSKGTQISDDEVMRRARDLGMVESSDQIGALLEERANDQTTTDKASTQQDTEQKTKTSEDGNQTTEKNNQTAVKKDSKDTDKKSTEAAKEETYELVVTSGMSSYPVCQRLQELGLIDNAEEFDDFLIEKGYASKISVGTHILKKGMTKEEIAYAISDK